MKYPSHDPAYVKAWRERYYAAHPEKLAALKERAKQTRLTNIDKARAKNREYYLKNKEKIKAATRRWAAENRAQKNASRRRRYKEILELSRAKGRRYSLSRRKSGKQRVYQRLYRTTNPGAAARYSATQHQNEMVALSDSYVRQILRTSHHIPNPTPEQIDHRRGIIQAKRASRQFRLLNSSTLLCKP